MIYSVKPYNQRLTTLNTHQQLAPVQRIHHRYAQEGFGEAETAKYVNFFARTLYVLRATTERRSACYGLPVRASRYTAIGVLRATVVSTASSMPQPNIV